MSKNRRDEARYKEIRNSKIFHEYTVGEKFEAGLVLTGTEVKALRIGRGQISDAFVRIDRGTPILYNAHIEEYAFGNFANHNPTRPRKLLLHQKEISRLVGAVTTGGHTIVPIRIYFKHGLAKVEIALCKGKKLYDKREAIKKREHSREAERAMRNFNRK